MRLKKRFFTASQYRCSRLGKTKGAWGKGYKGQGKVVAVIDTGIDPAHQSMRISDVSTAKVKSKEDMLARQKAAGINYGSWINDKVVLHIIMWKIAIISKKINSRILMRTGKTLSLMQMQSQKPSKTQDLSSPINLCTERNCYQNRRNRWFT